jgi:hypothetical protein
MKEVMTDVCVLGARMLNWILGNINDICIVAMNSHGILRKAIIRKKLLHSKQLSSAATSSYVFCFCSG